MLKSRLPRAYLLLIDLAILLLILLLAHQVNASLIDEVMRVVLLINLVAAWLGVNRFKIVSLDYYTLLIKTFVYTWLFSFMYLLALSDLKACLIMTSILGVWFMLAAACRWLLARRHPKLCLLVYEGMHVPTHPRIVCDSKLDLREINLSRYDAIIVDETFHYPADWRKLIVHAQTIGLEVVTLSKLNRKLSGKVSTEDLEQAWVENSFSVSWEYAILKRTADFLIVLLLAPIWLLVSLLIAICIIATMGRPILFVDRRVGQGNKVFKFYKFRSMVYDPNNRSETSDNDMRITQLGRILRKYRLDELPQLVNVLKGEMSLIGPRPEREFLVEKYSMAMPLYNIRHLVKPGITGWAQVNQGYAVGVEETAIKVQYDIYYIKHFSCWLDIKILVKTIKTVFTGDKAK